MAENTPQALARRFRGAFLCTIIQNPPAAPCAFARISSDFYPFMLLRHFNLFDLKIYMNSIALSAHKSKKKHKFVIYSICQGDFVRSVIHNYRYKKDKGCGAFLFFLLYYGSKAKISLAFRRCAPRGCASSAPAFCRNSPTRYRTRRSA